MGCFDRIHPSEPCWLGEVAGDIELGLNPAIMRGSEGRKGDKTKRNEVSDWMIP
jgi:hypothetical protein